MRIGIDLGGTKIECAAVLPGGALAYRRRIPTPRDDYEATLAAVVDLVETCERETGLHGSVGIGHPGAISPVTGLIKNANSTWLNERPLHEDLERRLRRPVRLANDANCFVLSEASDGAASGARVAFGVIIGTGTGGGVAVDGRVLVGPNAVAGEWGHNPLPWPRPDEVPGPACYCGRRGCIETFLSGPGLARDFARSASPTERAVSPPDAATVIRLAQSGNVPALEALGRYAERMARALASVINLLDPDVIVLGGGMSNLDSLYAEVPRLWGRWIFSDQVTTPLRRARHGDSSGVRGAAWLWDETPDRRPHS